MFHISLGMQRAFTFSKQMLESVYGRRERVGAAGSGGRRKIKSALISTFAYECIKHNEIATDRSSEVKTIAPAV